MNSLQQWDKSASLYVIIPVYNTKPYLHRCIDSILESEFKGFHIFCIDDGSTDGSGQLLDEISKKAPRITVIHQKNAGVSAARNTALKLLYDTPECQNAFISFVDSDDWVHPQCFSTLMTLASKNNLDACFCSFARPQSELKFHEESIMGYSKKEVNNNFSLFSINGLDKILSRGVWGAVFKIATAKNILFKVGKKLGEDTLWIIEYAGQNDKKIGYCDLPLYLYAQRTDSAVATVNMAEWFLVFNEMELLPSSLHLDKQIGASVIKYVIERAVARCWSSRGDNECRKKTKEIWERQKSKICLSFKQRMIIKMIIYHPSLYQCYCHCAALKNYCQKCFSKIALNQ